MANELDKTIEELEAEVVAELEEGNGADAPKKGATAAEPMKKKLRTWRICIRSRFRIG